MNANQLKYAAQLKEWKERVSSCRTSGISVRSWCLNNQVDPSTYYRWERKVLCEAWQSKTVESDKSLILPHSQELVEISETRFLRHGESTQPKEPIFHPAAVVKIGSVEISLSNNATENLIRRLKGLVSYAE